MKRKPHHLADKEPAAPLHCWDLFVEGYHAKMKLAEDISKIIALATENHWKHNFDFEQELFRLQHTIVITDPMIRIVYASSNMHQMNGYFPEEIIGQRPTIFQGAGTCPVQKANIRRAIDSQQPFEAILVNYRKNNEPYECLIKGSPVFTRTGRLVNFIAFEAIA